MRASKPAERSPAEVIVVVGGALLLAAVAAMALGMVEGLVAFMVVALFGSLWLWRRLRPEPEPFDQSGISFWDRVRPPSAE